MIASDFNQMLDDRLLHLRVLLCEKAKEYATDGDRLSNFKRAAALKNVDPIDALAGMVLKHIVAYYDFVEMEKSKIDVSDNMWFEKTGDIINYMLLTEALLLDRKQVKE